MRVQCSCVRSSRHPPGATSWPPAAAHRTNSPCLPQRPARTTKQITDGKIRITSRQQHPPSCMQRSSQAPQTHLGLGHYERLLQPSFQQLHLLLEVEGRLRGRGFELGLGRRPALVVRAVLWLRCRPLFHAFLCFVRCLAHAANMRRSRPRRRLSRRKKRRICGDASQRDRAQLRVRGCGPLWRKRSRTAKSAPKERAWPPEGRWRHSLRAKEFRSSPRSKSNREKKGERKQTLHFQHMDLGSSANGRVSSEIRRARLRRYPADEAAPFEATAKAAKIAQSGF